MLRNVDAFIAPASHVVLYMLSASYHHILQRMHDACVTSGRDPQSVRLLLATKTVSPAVLRDVHALGAHLFGENRVQEALPKYEALRDANAEWHFIGHLQTNKVKDALSFATCVQSVDRPSLITALQQEAAKRNIVLDVMVEVNTSGEGSKAGCDPHDVDSILAALSLTPNLYVTGFMTIGANTEDEPTVRACFALLRSIRDTAIASGRVPATAVELSMGMSGDLEWAIAEGSTMVRVGSAVFGDRM